MRIAYVSLHWPRTRSDGVGKKIARQLSAWGESGHQARLFMHLPASGASSDLLAADLFWYPDPVAPRRLRVEVGRVRAATELVRAVRLFQPDIIYLRYGMYVFPVHRLTSIAPTVEEINTNDLMQHEELGRFLALYNRLTRGILLHRVAGLVTVSRELAELEASFGYHKPTRTIANGIPMHEFAALPAPGNETPRIAFIGSPGYSWHGVDKLVRLARDFPDLHLDIVGYHSLAEFEPLPSNLSLHGYLESAAYLRVLADADVAVSTLALHRKGMREASPLKSRECLALGLPLIMAYSDTDLDSLECTFLLRIPNREDNVATHGRLIHDFAYAMRGKRADRALIGVIDDRHKEQDRLGFFHEVVAGTAR